MAGGESWHVRAVALLTYPVVWLAVLAALVVLLPLLVLLALLYGLLVLFDDGEDGEGGGGGRPSPVPERCATQPAPRQVAFAVSRRSQRAMYMMLPSGMGIRTAEPSWSFVLTMRRASAMMDTSSSGACAVTWVLV